MIQEFTLPHHHLLANNHYNVTTYFCPSVPHGPLPTKFTRLLCSVRFTVRDYIVLTVLYEEYTLWNFLWRSFPHISVRFVNVRYSKPVVKTHSSLMSAPEGSGPSYSRLDFFLIRAKTEALLAIRQETGRSVQLVMSVSWFCLTYCHN